MVDEVVQRPSVSLWWPALALFVSGVLIANLVEGGAGQLVGALMGWAGIITAGGGVVRLVRASRASRGDGRP